MPVLVAASLAGLSGLVIPENIVAVRPVSHSWSCPTRLRRSRTSATAPSRHAWRMAFPWSPRRTSRPVSRPARHVCRASTARSPTPARRRCSPRRRPCRPPRGPPAACICPTGACSSRPPARESSRAWPAGTPRPASAPGSGLSPGRVNSSSSAGAEGLVADLRRRSRLPSCSFQVPGRVRCWCRATGYASAVPPRRLRAAFAADLLEVAGGHARTRSAPRSPCCPARPDVAPSRSGSRHCLPGVQNIGLGLAWPFARARDPPPGAGGPAITVAC